MGIKLNRFELTKNTEYCCKHNWSIRIVAEATGDMSDKIFVYRASEFNDDTAEDAFYNVASLFDMDSIPEEEPKELTEENSTQNFIPLYRLNEVTLNFPNVVEMERVWGIIKADTKHLVREFNKANELSKTEEITYE